MDRRQFLFTGFGAVAATYRGTPVLYAAEVSHSTSGNGNEDPIAGSAEGPWRRLFLDAATVEQVHGLARVFYQARKANENPVVQRDRPWEQSKAISGPYLYGTVLREGDTFRMWYQFLSHGKIRFWLRNAELYSYLPSDLDPRQPDMARFPRS